METSTFTDELGFLSLAAQLKTVQEAMVHSARSFYKDLNLDIEPNWYLVFLLLKKHQQLSVTEISDHLGMAHPSVISIIKKMKKKGFLISLKDEHDSRKQLISLSEKAIALLPEFELVWKASEKAIIKMLGNDYKFLKTIQSVRIQLTEKDLMQRTIEELNNE